MKKISALFLSVGTLLVAVALPAQTVSQITIGRSGEYVQTGPSTVVIDPRPTSATYGGPYGFSIDVSGTGLTAPITVTLPGGTNNGTMNPTQHNGGVLGYNSGNGEFQYGYPNFNDIGTTTSGDRNARFPTGTYTVSSSEFTTVSLTLAPPASSVLPPAFALTGGTWSGGVYLVNPTSAVTISSATNAFAGFSQNADGGIAFSLRDSSNNILAGADFPTFYSANNAAPNYISHTINANTLTAGMDYTVFGSYIAIVDKNAVNGSFNAMYFESGTALKISAIPEPSTYAALAGVAALGLAAWHRRRRPAATA
jgi:hypothetical protein